MLEFLIIRFIELGAGLCGLIALIQVLKKDAKQPLRALFYIGFFLSLIQYRFAIYLSGASVAFPVAQTLGFISSIFAMGPAINSQFHSMLGFKLTGHRIPIRLQLIPAILVFAFEIYFIFLPTYEQGTLVADSFVYHKLGILNWLFIAAFAHILAYMAYFNFKYRSLKTELHLEYNRYFRVLISTPILAILGLGFGFLIPIKPVFIICSTLLSLIAILILIIEIKYPKFFETLETEIKERYARTQLTGLNVGDIKTQIENLMQNEKLYLDSAVRSSQVAEKVGITTNQLSRILNEQYQKNFNEFINGYRVEAAKTLLLNESEKTVLTIAYEAGFNSKSTFNSQFQKITGESPQEFRRKGL